MRAWEFMTDRPVLGGSDGRGLGKWWACPDPGRKHASGQHGAQAQEPARGESIQHKRKPSEPLRQP